MMLVKNMAHWEREKRIVESTPEPITKKHLVHDLKRLGVQPGDIISVHSSMSKIGWVIGDQLTVIEALMDAVTEDGTIIMQAHSTGNSDPRNWNYPPVPEEWWETIRREMPPFHTEITPLRNLGRVPELFRILPDVFRSNHPQVSCTAWGKHAKEIVKNHDLKDSYGENTPWGVLYKLGSKILLIGVDHESNTALHHAESKIVTLATPRETTGAAVIENGVRKWIEWEQTAYDSSDFRELGLAFESAIGYETKQVGQAESRLLPMRELVDFAIGWMQENR
jgi:aminoglycoside 3-N-acetyltransferase